MDDRRNSLFTGELGPLMLLSHVVLSNNLVTDRYTRRRHGMAVQAWSALYAVALFPGIRAKEITDLFPRPQNTISRALAMLEARKLIVQQPSPSDAREKLLYATEDGAELLGTLLSEALARQHELFGVLSDDERGVLMRLLGKLTANPHLRSSLVMPTTDEA